MSLPNLSVPEYKLVLPLSKLEVKFRPFLVKEEKILLMEAESIKQEQSDNVAAIEAMIKVIKSCTKNDINERKIPIIDLIYLFLNIRMKSVDEKVEIGIKQPSSCEETPKECGMLKSFEINLADVKIEKKSNKIQIREDIWVEMDYPTLENSFEYMDSTNSDDVFNMTVDYMKKIINGDNVIDVREHRKDELLEWVENLTQEQFRAIFEFLSNPPNLSYKKKIKCKKCDKEKTLNFRGLSDFFS